MGQCTFFSYRMYIFFIEPVQRKTSEERIIMIIMSYQQSAVASILS